MSLTVPQISRRRADQLGYLMAVLELSAVDLDHRARVADETLSGRLDKPGFARAGRSEEQKISDRPAGTRQARHVRLIDIDDLLNCVILADDASPKVVIKLLGIDAGFIRIKLPYRSHPFS